MSVAARGRLTRLQRTYILAVGLAFVGPFVPLLIASFAFRWTWPHLLPSEWWWDARHVTRNPIGWDYVFAPVSHVLSASVNSIAIALCVVVLCLAVSLPAARALAWHRFRGKSAVELWLLTPRMVPDIAVGIGILLIFIRLGLAGSYLGIIIAHLIPTMPYMIRMLTSVFQGLSRSYEEQARLLGAGRAQVLWHVTLPMIMPGIISGSLFTFLISSNLFLLTFFIGQGSIETLPTLLFSRIGGGGSVDSITAGIALIVSLPGVVVLVVTSRLLKDETFAAGFN